LELFIRISRAFPVLVKAGRNKEHITRRHAVRAFLHAFQTHLPQTVTGTKIFLGRSVGGMRSANWTSDPLFPCVWGFKRSWTN